MIKDTDFVGETQGEKFKESLTKAISKMQGKGLRVEIQFQQSTRHNAGAYFTAVVLGREIV